MSNIDYYKPLSAIPEQSDLALHEKLCDTEIFTRRLKELVPLLDFVDFRVESISPNKAVLSAPLLASTMNQNGTQQAALFYLLADYALGTALYASLPGTYIVGIHDRCAGLPVQMWLYSGQVQHRLPGTGRITAEAEISAETAKTMRNSLCLNDECNLTHKVRFYQNGRLIATAEHKVGIWADIPRASTNKTGFAQTHNLKTSALMIAGLRGDQISDEMAQEQGLAIAERMSGETPQLSTMVKARTKHIRNLLEDEGHRFEQVLLLGAGLDPKPNEFSSQDQKWFLCDLSAMLRERSRRLSSVSRQAENAVNIPVDLRLDTWTAKVLAAGFEPDKPTLTILEGVSMYLSPEDLARTLEDVRGLCEHRESKIWLDHVTEELIEAEVPEVKTFMSTMERLGEPFVTGFRNPLEISGNRWSVYDNPTSADILELNDDLHNEYRFAVLQVA